MVVFREIVSGQQILKFGCISSSPMYVIDIRNMQFLTIGYDYCKILSSIYSKGYYYIIGLLYMSIIIDIVMQELSYVASSHILQVQALHSLNGRSKYI